MITLRRLISYNDTISHLAPGARPALSVLRSGATIMAWRSSG